MSKIGLGLITCNREDFLIQAVESIMAIVPTSKFHAVCIINDGDPISKETLDRMLLPKEVLIQHDKNYGVAKAKNDALKNLMDAGCDHLFLMEDDIVFNDPYVIEKYITAAETSGIQHLNYGGHGIYNRDKEGNINTKASITVKDTDVELNLYHNILGAFSYYSREVIEKVGYMDENYHNAMEHVDHTYRIIQAGYHPPFWWFADIKDSWKAIEDIKPFHEESVIRKDHDKWMENLRSACDYFKTKHGFSPMEVPVEPTAIVGESLKNIRAKHGN